MTTSEAAVRDESREATPELRARLHRTVSVIAEALERRRRKIAAGVPVDPPPRCGCRRCGD